MLKKLLLQRLQIGVLVQMWVFTLTIFSADTHKLQRQPALQGGFDVEHSSVSIMVLGHPTLSGQDSGAYRRNSLEIDVYGGYAFSLAGVDLDIGILQFWYPGEMKQLQLKLDATEVYAGDGYDFGLLSAVSTTSCLSTDAWGFSDADGSEYWTLIV